MKKEKRCSMNREKKKDFYLQALLIKKRRKKEIIQLLRIYLQQILCKHV
jgi:hypothetical protein